MASHPAVRPMHAMLSLLFDMGHQLPLANTHSRQGRLIAILASDTPSAGNPTMAHNEGAPALPSLGSTIRRLQAIGHTIASKSGAYNNLGHRGQYAGEGAVHGSWSRLHAFWPRRARVRERARCRPRRLCSSTAASLYRRTSGLDVDGVLCGLECGLLVEPGFCGGGLASSLQWPRAGAVAFAHERFHRWWPDWLQLPDGPLRGRHRS